MAKFSAAHFEDATDFLSERGIEFNPSDLAQEFADLSRTDQDELWDIIDADDYDAFVDFCIEHEIHYHG